METFRQIPGYDHWSVSKKGAIFDHRKNKLVRTYMYGDRMFASYPDGRYSRLLAVHRAVALAWIDNDDPNIKSVVNHIDGNPLNNDVDNLEWTTPSGNNYHAVNAGLRSDNKPCRIRDFYTKEIREFPSIAQACEFMKLSKSTAMDTLRPRKFGTLLAGRYEFRLMDDPEPFFYETHKDIISPSRFMVEVEDEKGNIQYLFKNYELLKYFQIYKSPYGRSVPELVKYAQEQHPNKKIRLRDGFAEINRTGSRRRIFATTRQIPVTARREGETIEFRTMSEAARYFHVDRDVIVHRVKNPEITYLGWSFEGKPVAMETQQH